MIAPTQRESYQWRKKPVVIDAWQWDGDWDRLTAWLELLGAGDGEDADHEGAMWMNVDGSLTIPTLEGEHRCDLKDFIIRGVKGEFYPCKPDIFVATYEPPTPEWRTEISQSARCKWCGESAWAHHSAGYCYYGGTGEDATSFEEGSAPPAGRGSTQKASAE